MEPNDHDKSSLSESHFYVRDSATPSFYAYVYERMLTCAFTSQDSPECSHLPSLVAFRPLSASWQPSCNCALKSSGARYSCGPSRHYLSVCLEKQTPVPRSF